MTRPARIRARASFTGVLPGLVWPGQGMGAALATLKLPALSRLLGRAKISQQKPRPFLQWLARQFDATDPAWGELRWRGEGLVGFADEASPDLPGGAWLCADPVSIDFVRDALILKGNAQLGLTEHETGALVAALNAELGDIGSFHAATPQRWYLRTKTAVKCHFHPLDDVLGRPVALFRPEGEDAKDWARLENEIQVLLFNHPVNQARAERGAPLANGLWFWGAGTSTHLGPPADTFIGVDPVLRGLTLATNMPLLDPIEVGSPTHGQRGHTWWLDRRLEEAALVGDLAQWCDILAQMETALFAPLLTAWQQGRLDAVSIVSPSDKRLLEARLAANDKWKFWRKPLAPSALQSLLSIEGEANAKGPAA